MTEAVFGFIGVIIGAVASAGTTLWVTRWSFDRQMAREDGERLRQNVYAAQDALRSLALEINYLADDSRLSAHMSTLDASMDTIVMHIYRIGDDSLIRMVRDYKRLWTETAMDSVRAQDHLHLTQSAAEEAMSYAWLGSLSQPPMTTIWGLMEARLFALIHRPASFRPLSVRSTDELVDWDSLGNSFQQSAHSTDSQPDRSDQGNSHG